MQEEWKTIDEEGLEFYQISNTGRARIVDRDVPTRLVNHGREMIVTVHRTGKELKVQYDGGRPSIRMQKQDGTKCRRSLPLLVLSMFGEPCPGDIKEYTAGFIDGDIHNININNLEWIPKATLAQIVGMLQKGEEKEHFQKYNNLVFYFNDHILAYFKNTHEAVIGLNEMGFHTSETAVSRALSKYGCWFGTFRITLVSDEMYYKIEQEVKIQNLKIIYDILMEDRKAHRKEKKTIVKKHVVEKVVYKPKIVEKVVERVVYKTKIVEKVVYKDRVVHVPYEEDKEKKKVLVNDRTADVKKTQSKAVAKTSKKSKPRVTLTNTTKLDDIDDREFYLEQEQLKKNKFMEELMKRLK